MADNILYRSFDSDLEVKSGGDGRTVYGIAVPYGLEQRITASLTEAFVRGAFNHQLNAIHRVSYAQEHLALGGHLVGRLVAARDDAAGLYVEMRASKTPAGDETLELVRDGALPHLSVGFRERPGGNHTVRPGVVHRVKADLTEVASTRQGAYGDAAAATGVRAAVCPTCGQQLPPGERDEPTEDTGYGGRSAEAARLIAGVPMLPLADGVELRGRPSGLELSPVGRRLWNYFLHGAGSTWADGGPLRPHVWIELRDLLLKDAKGGLSPDQAAGLASNIFHAKFGVWPSQRHL